LILIGTDGNEEGSGLCITVEICQRKLSTPVIYNEKYNDTHRVALWIKGAGQGGLGVRVGWEARNTIARVVVLSIVSLYCGLATVFKNSKV
jgi:hypothetical protein